MKKEELLNEFMTLAKGKTQEELFPLMLAFSEKAKKENISFTKDDINSIAGKMKETMPKEDAEKIDAILKMAAVL